MDQQESANTEIKPTSPPSDTDHNGSTDQAARRKVIFVIITLAVAALAYFGLRYFADSFTYVSTDDAFLSANVVGIAPTNRWSN